MAFNKLQPDRTFYLRGFAGLGACAALHAATPTSFAVSGVFRDAADFAVLVIFDTDDFFGHPSIKALPDGNLQGIVLEFDVTYAGLRQLDSLLYATIDWPYLDGIRTNGTTFRVDLTPGAKHPGANVIAGTATTLKSGTHSAASYTFAVNASGANAGDTLALWYQNYAWVYPAGGGDTAGGVETYLAAQINATSWGSTLYTLSASVGGGGGLTITCNQPGAEGNLLRLYSVASNPSGLNFSPTTAQLAGGNSNVTWHVKIDFTALGIDSVRQLWLTFAPALADSAAYASTTWDATFSNWQITADPHSVQALRVAGPNSVRIEESDAWCKFTGAWNITDVGWFSKGFAMASSTVGDTIAVTYWCNEPHDLWLGTSVYSDRGVFGVSIDGSARADCNLQLVEYPNGLSAAPAAISEAISTRVKLASGLAAGQHSVLLTVKASTVSVSGISAYGFCYFDFLEAVVASGIPALLGPFPDRSPAIDYDTNHGYQLSPARLLWMFDQLGFTGPAEVYIGVFWWNQRAVSGQTLASATVTFGSGFAAGDSIYLTIGGTTLGKSVFAHETGATFATHFRYFINETFAGVWASASGSVLTITVRSADAAYQFGALTATTTGAGSLTVSGTLSGSVAGTWLIDTTQTPALNYGAAAWHADLFAGFASRSNACAAAFSMELVNPPDNPGAGHVWVARFGDGTAVLTATGFASLNSSQCVPMAPEFLAYQKAAYLHVAQLQTVAGLTPYLQFGEFLWWFFPNGGPYTGSGMAYYDNVTTAAALSALGRALHTFLKPTDDPSVNGYADANFLAGRLASHVAAIASYVSATYSAVFEVLYPNDVNGGSVTPISAVGGQLNAYVNFPLSWRSPSTAPFTILKLEQLAFATTDRNLDLVKAGIAFVLSLWPLSQVRYLYPIDNAGIPQWREYALAKEAGIAHLTPFAMDHVCLLNWAVAPPASPQFQTL